MWRNFRRKLKSEGKKERKKKKRMIKQHRSSEVQDVFTIWTFPMAMSQEGQFKSSVNTTGMGTLHAAERSSIVMARPSLCARMGQG